jgi:predicted nucleic acid-binding protein
VISATLDTSVYIRALHFGGPATIIIGHARAGNIRIDISDAIVAETNRVLRDKFRWDGYSLHDAREKLLALGSHVSRQKLYTSSKKIPTTTVS